MKDVEIFEIDLPNGHLAILRGGLGKPKSYMDDCVSRYVQAKYGGGPYNEFIEIFLDNPWVRVIITGINEFDYKEFNY